MKASDQVRIKYASKQARIANAWKKWIGENLGIEKSDAVAKRREFEATFKKAEYFVNVSYDALAIFPESEDKKILQNLTSFSLNRSF